MSYAGIVVRDKREIDKVVWGKRKKQRQKEERKKENERTRNLEKVFYFLNLP